MARQVSQSVENNFTKGLKTEFTGLNFPENASTDTDNCVYNQIGNVTRRLGIDYEVNKTLSAINRASSAISTYKWTNAGGDGLVSVYVLQVGATLHFFRYSSATTTDPISDQKLGSTITLSDYTSSGGSFTSSKECTFSDGNGYLFVFHPDMEPIYCTYASGTITATSIPVKIRDFEGIVETGVEDDFRSPTLTDNHNYNLRNQGWVSRPGWTATSTTSNPMTVGSKTFTVQTGLTGISGSQVIALTAINPLTGLLVTGTATVTSYTSGTGALVINITTISIFGAGQSSTNWTFSFTAVSYINTWFTAFSNYPSNADVWWLYKNSSGDFAPATTIDRVTVNTGPAPKGHFLLNAFNQDRSSVSGVSGLTTISTLLRPRIGAWFQGRVWYAGIDANKFTENIYFSQIIENETQFGKCYQVNDPTSEDRFDLLPSDGGLVRIQGCGTIYKLFPIQNGLLVFAGNGIWFVTGSQGIGFTANDYTVTKVSAVQSISSTSFVSVQGLPAWWNEEGIYSISVSQQGGITPNSLTISTIGSFYESIPLNSKKYARGDYNPLTYVVQWVYRNSEETNTTTRYEFDRFLNLNVSNEAFYPWSISGTPKVHGVSYIEGTGGSTAASPTFKILTSIVNGGSYDFTFSEERDTNYVDWDVPGTAVDYTSYFVTGYKLKGMAMRKFQPLYVYIYSDNNEDTSYKIQGIWDFANSANSGRYSSFQLITNDTNYFSNLIRRHKIRGHGIVLQIRVNSVAGEPFDILGWAIPETQNASV